jgi:hypothetical protein
MSIFSRSCFIVTESIYIPIYLWMVVYCTYWLKSHATQCPSCVTEMFHKRLLSNVWNSNAMVDEVRQYACVKIMKINLCTSAQATDGSDTVQCGRDYVQEAALHTDLSVSTIFWKPFIITAGNWETDTRGTKRVWMETNSPTAHFCMPC